MVKEKTKNTFGIIGGILFIAFVILGMMETFHPYLFGACGVIGETCFGLALLLPDDKVVDK